MVLSESVMPLKLKEYMKGSALSQMVMFVLIFYISSLILCFGLSCCLMVHSSFIKKKKKHVNLCFLVVILSLLKASC